MANKAMFQGLIYDEQDRTVLVKFVGGDAHYVVDDEGFLRHIDAEQIDRHIMGMFLEELRGNKDLVVGQALRMMNQDDLFTKIAVEKQIDDVDLDQILGQGLPPQARDMLSMMGFRVIVNYRGELVRIDQPVVGVDDE